MIFIIGLIIYFFFAIIFALANEKQLKNYAPLEGSLIVLSWPFIVIILFIEFLMNNNNPKSGEFAI